MTIDRGQVEVVRFAVGVSMEDVPARGMWCDPIQVPAIFLWRVVSAGRPGTLRLTFHDGTLVVNGTTLALARR